MTLTPTKTNTKINDHNDVGERPLRIIHTLPLYDHAWDNYHGNQWDRTYKPPFVIPSQHPVFKEDSQYNYIITGPTGGGKTSAGVIICLKNGFLRGKRVFSTIPIMFSVYDINNNKYCVTSETFDLVKFVDGDEMYLNSYVLLDEANFSVDVKKTMSNLNIGISDILQEGRKLDMCAIFTVLNPYWLDPRIVSTLADVKIECHDLYFSNWGNKKQLRKGEVTSWELTDITGKYTGHEWGNMGKVPVQNWRIWGYFNTKYFIKPSEQRKQLIYQKNKVFIDKTGQEYNPQTWLDEKVSLVRKLAHAQDEWLASELWEAAILKDRGEIVRLSTELSRLGVTKKQGSHGRVYDLSALVHWMTNNQQQSINRHI